MQSLLEDCNWHLKAAQTLVDHGGSIVVPASWRPHKGTHLTKDLVCGRALGRGVQGAVYDLLAPNEEPTGFVLKVLHTKIFAACTGMQQSFEREFLIGKCITQALQEADGTVKGFMSINAAVTRATSGSLKGQVLEKVNGITAADRMADPTWADIDYVCDMAQQTLIALDRAQRTLGFRHWDLRCSNIMEHDVPARHPPAQANEHIGAVREGSGGLERQDSAPEGTKGRRRSERVRYSFTGLQYHHAHLPSQRQDSSPLADDSHHGPSDGAAERAASRRALRASSSGVQERLLAASSRERHGRAEEPQGRQRTFKIIDFGHAGLGQAALGSIVPVQDSLHRSALEHVLHGLDIPSIPFAERLYRWWWYRCSDVFFMTMSLALILDGRVWLQQDAHRVEQLLGLIHHVTGVRVKAWAASEGDMEAARRKGGCYERRDGCCHWLRKWWIRYKAWRWGNNKGLTAAEALSWPFFDGPAVQQTQV